MQREYLNREMYVDVQAASDALDAFLPKSKSLRPVVLVAKEVAKKQPAPPLPSRAKREFHAVVPPSIIQRLMTSSGTGASHAFILQSALQPSNVPLRTAWTTNLMRDTDGATAVVQLDTIKVRRDSHVVDGNRIDSFFNVEVLVAFEVGTVSAATVCCSHHPQSGFVTVARQSLNVDAEVQEVRVTVCGNLIAPFLKLSLTSRRLSTQNIRVSLVNVFLLSTFTNREVPCKVEERRDRDVVLDDAPPPSPPLLLSPPKIVNVTQQHTISLSDSSPSLLLHPQDHSSLQLGAKSDTSDLSSLIRSREKIDPRAVHSAIQQATVPQVKEAIKLLASQRTATGSVMASKEKMAAPLPEPLPQVDRNWLADDCTVAAEEVIHTTLNLGTLPLDQKRGSKRNVTPVKTSASITEVTARDERISSVPLIIAQHAKERTVEALNLMKLKRNELPTTVKMELTTAMKRNELPTAIVSADELKDVFSTMEIKGPIALWTSSGGDDFSFSDDVLSSCSTCLIIVPSLQEPLQCLERLPNAHLHRPSRSVVCCRWFNDPEHPLEWIFLEGFNGLFAVTSLMRSLKNRVQVKLWVHVGYRSPEYFSALLPELRLGEEGASYVAAVPSRSGHPLLKNRAARSMCWADYFLGDFKAREGDTWSLIRCNIFHLVSSFVVWQKIGGGIRVVLARASSSPYENKLDALCCSNNISSFTTDGHNKMKVHPISGATAERCVIESLTFAFSGAHDVVGCIVTWESIGHDCMMNTLERWSYDRPRVMVLFYADVGHFHDIFEEFVEASSIEQALSFV